MINHLKNQPRDSRDAIAVAVTSLALSGLTGVYASRFFMGWPAQVVGGTFVAILVVGVLLGIIELVERL